jgi:hypothetical protein
MFAFAFKLFPAHSGRLIAARLEEKRLVYLKRVPSAKKYKKLTSGSIFNTWSSVVLNGRAALVTLESLQKKDNMLTAVT